MTLADENLAVVKHNLAACAESEETAIHASK